VRLWVVLSSLGAASCGDSVVIARELVAQEVVSAERFDAGPDAGSHVPGVFHGGSDGHPPSNAHLPPPSSSKPSVHPLDPPHHSSSSTSSSSTSSSSTSVPGTESSDGGSNSSKTSVHY
jgi:hypothetical protein